MSTMKILVAPDKFKGSLSAAEVAQALETGLLAGGSRDSGATVVPAGASQAGGQQARGPQISCRLLPLADGGDGSVQAALAAGFRPLAVEVAGPTGGPASATVAFDGHAAVVEVATTSGLQMLPAGGLAPMASSSAGFGQAIRAALGQGPRQLVLALGGSASTDGGAGMLHALGARFFDAAGRAFAPSGGSLADIARIELDGLPGLAGVDIVAANDVRNPLLGPDGAAAVYGPQKGADPEDVQLLEAGLANLVRRLEEAGSAAASCAEAPGAGSAGGLGFAAMLLGARMVSGADFFLDLLGFEQAAAGCDLVITGEGKLDAQTLSGKLPLVVARRSAPKPVVAVVGHNALAQDALPEHGIGQIHALSAMTGQDCAADPELSRRLLAELGRDIAQTLQPSKDAIPS
ncbi:glycerate kinase [Arthrobacter sp. Marseille-P9274]|uniref:glycerate kinase n=1 Tax=Arthrobacter sp. Marseille-P9274 TaxID=2866572 RepID=UPI0021C7520E|nr:glycerate kinase [Arthrobacter sp. Marseille-P9274]